VEVSLLGTARAARAGPAESRSSGGGGSRPLHRGEERGRSKKESDVEKVRVRRCSGGGGWGRRRRAWEGCERASGEWCWWWRQRWKRRRKRLPGRGDERDGKRDTITSCTRRASSHFPALLHEARSSRFDDLDLHQSRRDLVASLSDAKQLPSSRF
jgi:hypothetical protein